MSTRAPKLINRKGVSLLELIIALAVLSIITVAIFKIYVTQHKNYATQDDVTNIQQNARAAIDELGRQIRMAGFDLPLGVAALVPSDANPDTITVTYRPTSGCETSLSNPMSHPSDILRCGADVSCFSGGQWGYVLEGDSSIGEWFQISSVDSSSKHLQHALPLSRSYGVGSNVLAMTQVKFYVDNTTDPAHPSLMLQFKGQPPHIYAENISDLQFCYKLRNGVVMDEPAVVGNVREIMISVTGRSQREDAGNPNDPRRHREFATSVSLRNVGS